VESKALNNKYKLAWFFEENKDIKNSMVNEKYFITIVFASFCRTFYIDYVLVPPPHTSFCSRLTRLKL